LYNIALYEKALHYLRSRQIDFIYERYAFFSHSGLRLARALRVPHLLEVNATFNCEPKKLHVSEMNALACDMERRLWVETDRIFAVSTQIQAAVVAGGALPTRVGVLPDAVALERFDPVHEGRGMGVRKQYQLAGKYVIGFSGNLMSRQGIETLIAAFRRLHTTFPASHLLIVGDGPGREELQNYSRAHDLNDAVTFASNVSYDELPPYLDAMDIAVAPNLAGKKLDDLSAHILEYMAMSKAVVAANIEEVQEIIADGETGVLYEPGNVAQLVAALTKVASDEQFCCRLGDKARAWVQKERTWDNNVRQVVKAASSLIEKRRAEEFQKKTSMS
jgi:glycosyltransferase involved in cell wall biosynthesis